MSRICRSVLAGQGLVDPGTNHILSFPLPSLKLSFFPLIPGNGFSLGVAFLEIICSRIVSENLDYIQKLELSLRGDSTHWQLGLQWYVHL